MRFLPTCVVTGLIAIVSVISVSGCVPDPVTAMNVQGCIKKNCDEREATAYQSCEASCRQRYGR